MTWTDSLPHSDDRTAFSIASPCCSSLVQSHGVKPSILPSAIVAIWGGNFSPPWCWHSISPMITKKRNGNRKENGENKRSPNELASDGDDSNQPSPRCCSLLFVAACCYDHLYHVHSNLTQSAPTSTPPYMYSQGLRQVYPRLELLSVPYSPR